MAAEKRLESRYLCADLVRVSWVERDEGEPNGIERFSTVDAVLEDISTCGACIQVEAPIPEGRVMALTAGDAHLAGYVTYCVAREFGYYVGLEFSENSKWRSEEFTPQHLINLQSLIPTDN